MLREPVRRCSSMSAPLEFECAPAYQSDIVRNRQEVFMKHLILVLIGSFSFCLMVVLPQQALPQQSQNLEWAYPVPDKNPPPAGDAKEVKRLPGSTKSYTQAQID